jgi:hypothetical protein
MADDTATTADIKTVAQNSKAAYQAGDLEGAARLLGSLRSVHPDAEQGPNGEVMVGGVELSA